MLAFRSEAHVDRWCSVRALPRGAVFDVERCWQLAWAWYRGRLERGWRRRSPEETEAVFAAIGLEGAFWRLRP